MSVTISENKVDCVINVLFFKISKLLDETFIQVLETLEIEHYYKNKENYKPIVDFLYSLFVTAKRVLVDTLTTVFKKPLWPVKPQFLLAITCYWNNLEDEIVYGIKVKFNERSLCYSLISNHFDGLFHSLLNFIDQHSNQFRLFTIHFNVDYYISYWKNNIE